MHIICPPKFKYSAVHFCKQGKENLNLYLSCVSLEIYDTFLLRFMFNILTSEGERLDLVRFASVSDF